MNWKKEVARDCIALGSIPFYIIVLIRAIIGEYAIFVYQLLIAFLILFGLSRIIKYDVYVARVFILFLFTSLFYEVLLYTSFAFLLWILVIASSWYLKVKKELLFKGIVFGLLVGLVSYYFANFFGL